MSFLLNDWRTFSEVFRKDVAYNIIKGHKNARFHSLSRKYIFGKTIWGRGGGGQIDPPSLFSANNNKSHKLQLILSNTCFLSQSFSVVTIIKVTINNLDDC